MAGTICDKFCDGCDYVGRVSTDWRCCQYIFVTDKKRPCGAGAGCTVRHDSRLTPEEKRKRAAMKAAANREKRRQQRMRTKICPICGKEFQTTDGRLKYCSYDCAKEYNRRRNAEYKSKKRGEINAE